VLTAKRPILVDTKEERNALMERVYPKLSEFCRDNYGMEFQVEHFAVNLNRPIFAVS